LGEGEATDRLDAIEKARDLIILDLSMPRLDGLEAARKLRSVEVPIFLFTMYDDVPRPEQRFEARISAVVSKMDSAALQHHVEKTARRSLSGS
jgi:CheY-like chemotaxis protein